MGAEPLCNYLVVGIIDKVIIFSLVHRDTEFRVDIVFELIVVPIQMVRSYVKQHGNMGGEMLYAV